MRHSIELVLGHVPRRVLKHVPVWHVLKQVLRHVPTKHVPDHVLGHVLEHVTQNRYLDPPLAGGQRLVPALWLHGRQPWHSVNRYGSSLNGSTAYFEKRTTFHIGGTEAWARVGEVVTQW